MADEPMRAIPTSDPFAPERREIAGPLCEILDMAGDRVDPKPARSGLPTPVKRGHSPALSAPVIERFEVLFVSIAAAGQEQEASASRAWRFRPIDAADRVPVLRKPAAFAGIGRNGSAIEGRGFRRIRMTNASLLPVVTI
jgi:hypothetical protein